MGVNVTWSSSHGLRNLVNLCLEDAADSNDFKTLYFISRELSGGGIDLANDFKIVFATPEVSAELQFQFIWKSWESEIVPKWEKGMIVRNWASQPKKL